MVRQKPLLFRFIAQFECLEAFLALVKFKPSGPSNIPLWDFQDVAKELAETFVLKC